MNVNNDIKKFLRKAKKYRKDNNLIGVSNLNMKLTPKQLEIKKEKAGNCPNCNYEQVCGCISCAEYLKEKSIKPHLTDKTGEIAICANCGFSAHYDWWESWEYDCWKAGQLELK